MNDHLYSQRWDPSSRVYGSQPEDNPYFQDYSQFALHPDLSTQEQRLSPPSQHQSIPHTPEERPRTQESSSGGTKKLRKTPPRPKVQPSHQNNHPLEDIALFDHGERRKRTPPPGNDTLGFIPPVPQLPQHRGRSTSPIPIPYQYSPPVSSSFKQRMEETSRAGMASPLGVPPISHSRQRDNVLYPSTFQEPITSVPPIPPRFDRSNRDASPSFQGFAANFPVMQGDLPNSSNAALHTSSYSVSPRSYPPRGAKMLVSSQASDISNRWPTDLEHTQQKHQKTRSRISKPRPNANGILKPPPNNQGYRVPVGASEGQEFLGHPHIFTQEERSRSASRISLSRAPSSYDGATNVLIAHPEYRPSERVSQIGNADMKEGHFSSETQSFLNRAVTKLRIKKAFHWTHPAFFHPYAIYNWSSPYSYQLPGRFYKIVDISHIPLEQNSLLDEDMDLNQDEETEQKKDLETDKKAKQDHIKYLDVFRRKTRDRVEDRYVDPRDGRLGILVVQCTSEIYNSRNKTTWRRTYIENISPYFIRLAYWPTGDIDKKIGEWKRDEWVKVGLRWLPSCIGLLLLMYLPTDAEGQIRNMGRYDAFPYRYWLYPKTARNMKENRDLIREQGPELDSNDDTDDVASAQSIQATRIETLRPDYISKRKVRPRKLCFLDAVCDENPNGLLSQKKWATRDPRYIFVSYTGSQFGRRCSKKDKDCTCSQCLTSESDAKALHETARIAAKNAGVGAYWTDQCCMSRIRVRFSQEIYRISDVSRGAHALALVIGESGGGCTKSDNDLLAEWGTRMWTFPELLLGPSGKLISVYKRGRGRKPLWELSKLNLTQDVWAADGFYLKVRELIDHYDGTITLSRLELVVIALECLLSRETTIFSEGDLAYALMGLLRQRPTADQTDSAFQAFARLSLANDSDKLLERMICLLPKDHIKFNSQDRHYWATLDDLWGAKLWDVDPLCQIAAIGEDDTVIIDGAFAATIHWDCYKRVAITTKETWSRMISRLLFRMVPLYVTLGASLSATRNRDIGIFFLVAGAIIVLVSPILTLHIYGGKAWSTQPWFFGFEGHMPIKEIETKIFGFPQNRLSWAPYGSSLSEHRPRKSFLKNECRGIDPTTAARASKTRNLVDCGPTAEYGESRVFTLVDTNTMTVTLFEAERPPAVVLICGSEGGMQRAVLCSYDWPTQTLYRETVLRMETRVLEKMSMVPRVSFGLRRNVKGPPETWPRPIDMTELAGPLGDTLA